MAKARRKFSEEFKQEAVRLVTVRGVSMAQAARDLSIHVNLLRTWMRTATSDAAAAATGRQSAKSGQAELTRLRKEVTTLRMERDILKKAAAGSTGQSNSLCKNSRGCAKAEGFAWACVQLHRNMVQIALGVDG